MGRLVSGILAAAVVAAWAPRLGAQPVGLGTVAIAPIVDEVGFREPLARWAGIRLGQLLTRQRFTVIGLEQSERGLRETGLRPADLLTLAGAAGFGSRLGADAVITGRLLRADVDPNRLIPPPGSPDEIPEPPEGYVTIDFRLLRVADRAVILRYEAFGYSIGSLPLQSAAEMALLVFIARIPR